MMSKKKIMLVFGTRPEAIKMAPLYHALMARQEDFETLVCITAQHRQLLDQMLRVFEITPHIDLNVMKSSQDLVDITASVLTGMRGVFKSFVPNMALVHGDTTTTLATAMAGFYCGVPVGHVEAGLRTYDLHAPFPEEFNRQVVTKLARWHFAPTTLSRRNLLQEKVPESDIVVTGNTVIDTLLWSLARIDENIDRRQSIVDFLSNLLAFSWQSTRFVLITGHRRENFGNGFLQICEALKALAARYPDVHFVYPVHLNQNVQRPVRSILTGLFNVHLIEPLDYEPFIYLLKYSYLVLTDSGGIQEEAPCLGKPVLVMRDVTERPEAVDAGTVRLVGSSMEKIIANVSDLLENKESYRSMARAHNPYGDGKACERIIDVLRAI
jgi:UDP-N-acetylglucosamine 2-epimerase (non-hydrolysing)